ncbi:hypothetical protein X739_33005 [Mesorhizobium sp. LNHC220B00]|nr:RelA/SpoT domain-containing protein [Mesorhizobium sp. LNHC220B00]ESY77461.1 hypothetical protein X739_33005 [Mesorhizobium sp. LNHC220B00]
MITRQTYAVVEAIEIDCVASIKRILSSRIVRQGSDPLVQSRIKSPISIERKLGRKLKQRDANVFVNDFLGIRIILFHIGQLENAVAAVTEWVEFDGRFEIADTADYFQHKASGHYRSFHLDLRFKSEPELQNQVGLELQITTYLRNFQNTITHQLAYHHNIDHPDIGNILDRISYDIGRLDDEVSALFDKSQKAD